MMIMAGLLIIRGSQMPAGRPKKKDRDSALSPSSDTTS